MILRNVRNNIRSLLLSLAVLAVAFPGIAAAAAKPVDDYLHGGAARYIQGRLQEAGVEVEEGLRHYPNDSRLKALANQLKNMKDQQKKDQGGQSSQGGDENKDKQDKKDSSGQGDKDGKKDQKDQKDQKDKEKEKEKEQEGKDKDKDKGGQDQKPQPEEGKEGDSSGQAAAPAKPGQMSKEEAERLLNSYQDDEKREQKQLQKRNRQPVEVEEDW
ncbi:MAG: Ca-activated chloride channel family protein [Fibrobacteres bacterium]|nr:Ca-activated chloride channel family protein [Fibrobacterota bacterium]